MNANGRGGHPLFGLLAAQGRQKLWLARQINFSHSHVRNVASGLFPASPRFRRECARVMDRPESDLFHDGNSSSASPSGEIPLNGSDDPALEPRSPSSVPVA